ncbi:MAG: triose-phosphate isomerase [Pseudomonadota bacterium]
MNQRKPIIAGNWKMHNNTAQTRNLIKEIFTKGKNLGTSCEVIIAPAFTSIACAIEEVKGSHIQVAAQNIFWEDKGAFTGEISGPMLKEIGCSHVIIGHSERRQYFGETDESVNKKIAAAIKNDLIPIFCLGETLVEREAEKTFEVMKRQLTVGLGSLVVNNATNFIVAYEPVWAIGTGKTASPQQAQEAHAFLRKELSILRGEDFANKTRILYGGSVKPDNAKNLIGCADIDGGLIGGASLKAEDFVGIIENGTGI